MMINDSDHKQDYIITSGYTSVCQVFKVVPPAIESGYVYHFTTSSGLLYEVRFAPKASNILGMVVNFTVVGDEFENDYPVTNRGEAYSIIATVIEIIKIFHLHHNFTNTYEFSGEFKEDEHHENASIRTRLYLRYADKVLNHNWKAAINGNKVVLRKVK